MAGENNNRKELLASRVAAKEAAVERNCEILKALMKEEVDLRRRLGKVRIGSRGEEMWWWELPIKELTVAELLVVERVAKQQFKQVTDYFDNLNRARSSSSASPAAVAGNKSRRKAAGKRK